MSISAKNLTLLFGLAAGTAITLIINKASERVKKISRNNSSGSGYTVPGRKPLRHLYDDSEVYYV